ncbi:MAG: YggS family pyridoxal phosphate-dependent enzyme [Bacteroidales bacterium]|nr:YggS family pyridoxal phosphate-dependent enzyme [Bacteroidales bacterium]
MIKDNLQSIIDKLPSDVKLVAVSKFHPSSAIVEAYEAGQRVFAESRPQELDKKVAELAAVCPDIEWQFIGHLQTNKLKMVLPHVSLVQSVDTIHLLQEIDRWGKANGKVIDVLIEMHIGEDTKQGFYEEEALDLFFSFAKYRNVRFRGLMGMASFVDDEEIVLADFSRIADFYDYVRDVFPEMEDFNILSIGMSGDWPLAVRAGSNMVRIGSAIFGERV